MMGTPIRRIRILIEREDGKVVGWDIGHPDDVHGQTTMDLEKNYGRGQQVGDGQAGVGGTFRIYTTGGYRRINPQERAETPAIESGSSVIEGVLEG